jgi:hypothetical protein
MSSNAIKTIFVKIYIKIIFLSDFLKFLTPTYQNNKKNINLILIFSDEKQFIKNFKNEYRILQIVYYRLFLDQGMLTLIKLTFKLLD